MDCLKRYSFHMFLGFKNKNERVISRKGFFVKNIPEKSVERLCKYRQILLNILDSGKEFIFSHELAAILDSSPAQVRRDLMMLNITGTPQRGYNIRQFLQDISEVVDTKEGQLACLVGVGKLGQAILTYFSKRRPNLSIVAGFDSDVEKAGKQHGDCSIFAIDELQRVIREKEITVGIVTVPAPHAQTIVDTLVASGVKGIVNFAPTHLRVPQGVFLENLDITLSVEKTAYFAKFYSDR